jgi:uncharacterized protein YkwD
MIAAPGLARSTLIEDLPTWDQEKSSIWWMQEGASPGIIPCMQRWMGSMFRYLLVVAAVLAGLAAGEQSASATSYDSEELHFLQLINDYRKNNGLGNLLLSDTLSVSSERHSQDMARYRFFAHNTAAGSSYYPVGSTPWDRMQAEGYGYRTVWGENIAAGCESAERCFELWRNSPSHNAAMLDGDYHVIGIARIHGTGPMHRWYWTTDFGGTVDPTAHAPGESPPAEETNEQQKDGAGLENGALNGDAVWEQEATDRAELILDGHARLGDYDNGKDELRQKIRIGEDTRLAYRVKITTDELRPPVDRLLVRLTNEEGRQIAVLEKYGSGDAGGWRHERVDLSRFAGQTFYLSFYAETDPAGLTAFYVDDVVLKDGRDGS